MHCQATQPPAPQCQLPPASAPSKVQRLPCLQQLPQRDLGAALPALQFIISSGPRQFGGQVSGDPSWSHPVAVQGDAVSSRVGNRWSCLPRARRLALGKPLASCVGPGR